MQELTLRKLHRYLGALIAPLLLMQAASGLMLSLDILGRWQRNVRLFLEGVDLPALALFWDTVLYNIHFGSGTAGLVHNVAAGAGLVLLVVSGVLIFVKVLSRTRFRLFVRARPAPAAARASASAVFEGGGAVPRRGVAAALAVAALGLIALDIYIFATSYRMSGLHVPHLYAASVAQVETARSRVAVELLRAGDPDAPIDRVWETLEQAERAVDSLLVGRRKDGRQVLPVESTSLRRRVEGVAEGVRQLKFLTIEQFMEPTPPGGADPSQLAYGRTFDGTLASAQGVVEALMDTVERDRERFFTVHLVLFTMAFLFLVGVAAVLAVYEAGRTRHLAAVHAARDLAHVYEKRFREVVRQGADPLLVFDEGGHLVEASLTAAYLLGYEEEELRTLNVEQLEPCTTPEEREALWGELVPGAPTAAKSCWRHRDGTDIPVVLSLAVVATEEGDGRRLVLAHARHEDAASGG